MAGAVSAMKLAIGAVIQCAVCGLEHTVVGPKGNPTTAAKDFCYVLCRNALYYVGSVGGESNRGPVITQESK